MLFASGEIAGLYRVRGAEPGGPRTRGGFSESSTELLERLCGSRRFRPFAMPAKGEYE